MSTNNHNGRHISAGQKVGAGGGVESRQKRLGFLSFGFQNRRETSNSAAFVNLKRKTTRKHLFFAGQGEGHQVGESIPQMCSLDYSWLDNGING